MKILQHRKNIGTARPTHTEDMGRRLLPIDITQTLSASTTGEDECMKVTLEHDSLAHFGDDTEDDGDDDAVDDDAVDDDDDDIEEDDDEENDKGEEGEKDSSEDDDDEDDAEDANNDESSEGNVDVSIDR